MRYELPEIQLDFSDPFIQRLTKRITFLDIETSLINARVFRAGNQFVGADQLQGSTKILTVAYGSLYDLWHKGESAVKVLSNRKSSTFREDPTDDTELLEKLWPILDRTEVLVAHNAAFDKGWMSGRFVENGWRLPSRYFTFCTYRNLQPFQLTSKKLDELSKRMLGTQKLKTDFDLWSRCSDGDVAAFKQMELYNVGDVYNTLFKLWKKTAYFNPVKAIDFTNAESDTIQCRVDGGYVEEAGLYYNRSNGKVYNKYVNPRSGQAYQDRYNTDSKKAGLGLIKPLT